MMHRKQIVFGIFFTVVSSLSYSMLLDSDIDVPAIEKKIKSIEKKRSVASTSSELVEFSYKEKNIKDLLNEFARKLDINILFPQTETIASTVTFDAGKKVTMTEAWDFVTMICDQAGYSLVLRGSGNYMLIGKDKSFTESLPLYINVDYMQLADSAERIRFIYYFNNIQLGKQQAELQAILTNILPAQDLAKQLVFDVYSNSMILTTRAEMVKAVMQLVVILDESGFQEAVDVLEIKHAKAADVVTILKNLMGGSDAAKKTGFSLSCNRDRYFSEYVRVENLEAKNSKAISKLNSIVILGKVKEVEDVKKFIKTYLDVPLGSGKSFFHVVELQWLDAIKFKDVLRSLVTAGDGGGTGQSTGSSSSDLSFESTIKIEAEAIATGSSAGSNEPTSLGMNASSSGVSLSPLTNQVQRGGNKLVIACSDRDWDRIESLIKQLDIPQKQVIIEAVVMDLDLSFVRSLGAQIRTRGLVPAIFPKDMQAQAGLLINNIVASDYNPSVPGSTPTPGSFSLLGDLSDILNPLGVAGSGGTGALQTPQITGGVPSGTAESAASAPGSTIFMLNGGKERTNGVWAFFQLIASHSSAKVFIRPTLMALNNQPATVFSNVTKNLPDAISNGNSPTINYKLIPCPISVQFTPLISDNDSVSLQIAANLIAWVNPASPTDGTKLKRILNTNVSMKSGDMLILGGLISEEVTTEKNSVPFLEHIPIFGNFFANRNKIADTSQLYLLIRPTVVVPRAYGGMGPITKSASNYILDKLADSEETFGSLKDPITRWFFSSGNYESAAEFYNDKIEDLPAKDFGKSEDLEKSEVDQPENTQTRKKENHDVSMKIGWFSDAPLNSKFAAKTAVDGRVETLTKFLKDIENPFEQGLQNKQRLQV